MTDGSTAGRSVICGVDDPDGDGATVAVARALCDALGARLVLAHVQQPTIRPPTIPGSSTGVDMEADARAAAATAEGLLDRVAARGGAGDHERRVVAGDVADGLRRQAEEDAAAVVVVGSRGRGPRAGAVLGSVSSDLLSRADRPVVVVPRDAPAPPPTGGAVVCGVDAPPRGGAAARAAGAVADALGARLVLAHVVEEEGAGAADLLTGVADRQGLGAAPDLRVVRGNAVEALAGVARDDGAVLLVIGGEAAGAVRRAAAGDTATELIGAAPCPVMVVRDGSEPALAGAA